jgi:hypothetical protein
MDSQTIRLLQQENTNNSWAIQSLSEIMAYHKAMSTYYPSVFESLDMIYSSATNAEDCINQYNVYFGEYEGYVNQYDAIKDLAYSNWLLISWVGFKPSGVAIPMVILGKANWFESKLDTRKPDVRKWRRFYNGIIGVYIVLFVSGAILGLIVLWTQISKLIPPL